MRAGTNYSWQHSSLTGTHQQVLRTGVTTGEKAKSNSIEKKSKTIHPIDRSRPLINRTYSMISPYLHKKKKNYNSVINAVDSSQVEPVPIYLCHNDYKSIGECSSSGSVNEMVTLLKK